MEIKNPKRFNWSGEFTSSMQKAYADDGFLVIDEFVTNSVCEKLLKQSDKLIDDFNLVDDKASAKNIIQQFKKNNPIKRTYKDLADFDMDFNLNLESERFKSAIRKSNGSDIRKVFVNSRKNHVQRFDYDSL